MSKKTDKNKNESVNQREVGAADLEKVSGGAGRTKRRPPKKTHQSTSMAGRQ